MLRKVRDADLEEDLFSHDCEASKHVCACIAHQTLQSLGLYVLAVVVISMAVTVGVSGY
jgi:hypothetical protein